MADPKRVVERHVEAFNARDADAEPWSEDADFVAPNASMHGRDQVLGFLGVLWDAFPDGRLETSRLLAEGSVVAAEGRFMGTHTRCHAHAGGRRRGHGTARRLPLDVELRGSRRRAGLGTSLLRSGRPARPARTDAGDLSALLPCAKRSGLRSRTEAPAVNRKGGIRRHVIDSLDALAIVDKQHWRLGVGRVPDVR
jgi:SnoaL-like domain